MFKLFDTKDLLEHVEELLLRQNALTVEWLHTCRPLMLIVTYEISK